MGGQFFVVSSITYAYKGKNILEKYGCKVYIEREPKNLSKCGCHYCLVIRDFPADRAEQILEQAHIRVIGRGSHFDGIS